MYPRQGAYPTQPVDTSTSQQYPAQFAPQPAVAIVPPAIQYNEEEKALVRRNAVKMIIVYVIGIISFTVGLPLLINGAVQTALGKFTGAISVAFITVGCISLLISVCMLILGLVLLGRIRAEEAEMKSRRDERIRTQQQSTQFQAAYSNPAFPSK